MEVGATEMGYLKPFSYGAVESLAIILGDYDSGSRISRVLAVCGLRDDSRESTKWRRLLWVFDQSQQRYKSPNHILRFIQEFLSPVKSDESPGKFEEYRLKLNRILAYEGCEYRADGKFGPVKKVQTHSESQRRMQTIRERCTQRRLNSEVVKYCRSELMQENYFHAVFEATKGLAQHIKDKTGSKSDGAKLIDEVFLGENPMLAFNTLRTPSERSQHNGLAMLLKGCFGAIRNPLAHEPKILWDWDREDDAVDYLTLVSMLYGKLDKCVSTSPGRGA